MIGRLSGLVAAVGEDACLIDVGGVGYVVSCGSRTLARLTVGEAARLAVETHVREDAIRLFGFLAEEERAWFTHLQGVPGVGAKVALAILDVLGPAELADALAVQDRASIARANGVGPKLAQRIAQELSLKPPPCGFLSGSGLAAMPAAAGPAAAPLPRSEAVSALVNLGIDQPTAARAVATAAKALGPDTALQDLIRAALKEIKA
jgi:Holliday junction DNA helicase RuvA